MQGVFFSSSLMGLLAPFFFCLRKLRGNLQNIRFYCVRKGCGKLAEIAWKLAENFLQWPPPERPRTKWIVDVLISQPLPGFFLSFWGYLRQWKGHVWESQWDFLRLISEAKNNSKMDWTSDNKTTFKATFCLKQFFGWEGGPRHQAPKRHKPLRFKGARKPWSVNWSTGPPAGCEWEESATGGSGERCDTLIWGGVARFWRDISDSAGIWCDTLCTTLCSAIGVSTRMCH